MPKKGGSPKSGGNQEGTIFVEGGSKEGAIFTEGGIGEGAIFTEGDIREGAIFTEGGIREGAIFTISGRALFLEGDLREGAIFTFYVGSPLMLGTCIRYEQKIAPHHYSFGQKVYLLNHLCIYKE